MGERRNQKENQNIFWKICKWKWNILDKVLYKKKKSQINYIIFYL